MEILDSYDRAVSQKLVRFTFFLQLEIRKGVEMGMLLVKGFFLDRQ